MPRTTNNEIGERLARVEGKMEHLATNEQLAVVSEQIKSIKEGMPKLRETAEMVNRQSGYRDAKEDTSLDHRAWAAIGISMIAALIALMGHIVDFFWTPGE